MTWDNVLWLRFQKHTESEIVTASETLLTKRWNQPELKNVWPLFLLQTADPGPSDGETCTKAENRTCQAGLRMAGLFYAHPGPKVRVAVKMLR